MSNSNDGGGPLISFFSKLWEFIKSQLPVFLLAIFQYEEGKIDQKEKEKDAIALELKKEQNEEAVREKYEGTSDIDVVRGSLGDSSDPTKPKT